MSEVGCLKDGHYQNFEVSGSSVIPNLYGGIQRQTIAGILTIGEHTTLAVFAIDNDSSRVVTLPSAKVGRHFKIFWEVEQATSDRVLTCAGSDDIVGLINCSVAGDAVGDGDILFVTDGGSNTAITIVDDVNIGSMIEFYCAKEGTWLMHGHITYDGVGSIPTAA